MFIGQQLWYHTETGSVSVTVTQIWARQQGDARPPVVNLSNGVTSVQHVSDVPGATSRFYTFGTDLEAERTL